MPGLVGLRGTSEMVHGSWIETDAGLQWVPDRQPIPATGPSEPEESTSDKSGESFSGLVEENPDLSPVWGVPRAEKVTRKI